jgi:hypothetical protein
MTQALYVHMNNKRKKRKGKKRGHIEDWSKYEVLSSNPIPGLAEWFKW